MSGKNPIKILYEDDDVLVINKPSGLVVHSDGKTIEPSLADWVLEKYPEMEKVGEPMGLNNESKIMNNAQGQDFLEQNSRFKIRNSIPIFRPGIVHRLDRETSGTMVLAKNQKSFENLKKQFQSREVSKVYHAFVWGEMKVDEGVIDRPIGKSRSDFRKWSAQRGAKGEMREAVTRYKVLGRRDGISFVEAQPKTGRTHQIRVHLKAINHPVVGDKLYAPKRDFALGFKRLALHSRSIRFVGLDGKEIFVTADYPEDFGQAVGIFAV